MLLHQISLVCMSITGQFGVFVCAYHSLEYCILWGWVYQLGFAYKGHYHYSNFLFFWDLLKNLFSTSVLTRWYLKIGINISLRFYFLEAVIACNKGIKFCLSVEVCVLDVPVLTVHRHSSKIRTSDSKFFLICIGWTWVISLISPSADQTVDVRTFYIPWWTRDEACF